MARARRAIVIARCCMSRFILASFATLLPAEAVAHAFGERYDLPLPLHLWIAAAGLTVALSFVVIAASLRRRASHPRSFFLVRLHPVVVTAFRAVSVCVLFLLIAAGLFGTQDPFRNFAPAFVWIAWWIGFTYLTELLGDVWRLLNPWKALYPAGLGLRRELPAAVGVWPAVALLLAFAWIEIVWEGNAVPANIAWLALGYSILTWTGMYVFG